MQIEELKKYEDLAKARIKNQIRMFGFIDYYIAFNIVKEIFNINTPEMYNYFCSERGYRGKQGFFSYSVAKDFLDRNFDIYSFLECKFCFIRFFEFKDMKEHLMSLHDIFYSFFDDYSNFYSRKKLLSFTWETNKPFSPSKIKPDWWTKEERLVI